MRDNVFGNGRLAVAFDESGRLRDLYHPGVGLENHLGGRTCHLGIEVLDCVLWIDETWQHVDEGEGTCVLLAPWEGLAVRLEDAVAEQEDVLLRKITVLGRRDRDLAVRLFIHHDFIVGENHVGNGVRYDPASRSLLHHRRDHWFLLGASSPTGVGVDEWSIARDDDHGGQGVRAGASDEELDRNPIAVGAGESLIALRGVVPAAGEVTFETWLVAGDSREDVVRRAHDLPGRFAPQPRHELPRPVWAGGLDDPGPRASWLAARSLDIIRAHIDADGGIVASLDSGLTAEARESYAYVWPRDAALIADSMLEAGHPDVARRYVDFAVRTVTAEGFMPQRSWVDGTPASSWHAEEEPGSPLRPIQEDETALTLRCACRFADEDAVWNGFITRAADFLAGYVDETTGLPWPSHDLWEERHGIHAFTAATVSGALEAAAVAADRRGDAQRSEAWRRAGEAMHRALLERMFHRDAERFARTAHAEGDGLWLDATPDASLLLLHRVEPRLATAPEMATTVESTARALAVEGLGLARYEGDTYHQRARPGGELPGNPWIIATLWLADWRIDHAENVDELEEARALIALVTDQAAVSGALPEQVHPLTGAPLSVRPLAWSHAAFLSTWTRYRIKLETLLGFA